MAKDKKGRKMSASEADQKGGKAPHAKRGQRGSDQNFTDEDQLTL